MMHGLPSTPQRVRRLRTTATVVSVCVVVAALALAWLVVRAVGRERNIARGQLLDAAVTVADGVGPQILRQWTEWESWIPRAAGLANGALEFVATLEPTVEDAIKRGAVVVRIREGRAAWWPRSNMLYEPEALRSNAPPSVPEWPPAMLRAEAAELGQKDYAAAAAAYRALMSDRDDRVRSEAQLRLGRTLRKAGRLTDALSVYDQALRDRRRDNGLDMAAAAVERCALFEEMKQPAAVQGCALGVFDGLVQGRWQLDGPHYHYYSRRVRDWLAPVLERGDVATRTWAEDHGLASTRLAHQAVERWLALSRGAERDARQAGDPARTGHMLLEAEGATGAAVWRADAEPGTVMLLVMTPIAVGEGAWLPIVRKAPPGCYISISADSRDVAVTYRGAATRPTASVLTVNRVEDGPILWRIAVWWDAESLSRAWWMRSRQFVDWGALALMLSAIAVAGVLVSRSIRRERAVARMKSEFVSTVSHEFRSPLAAISHLSELLEQGRVPDEARRQEYYRLIVGESGRLSRLVENLLDFARIEEGRAQYELMPTAIGDWLPGVVEEFRGSRAAAGKQIDLAVADGLPAVRVDARAIGTAVVNLLDNAVKYSPDRDTVWVEAAASGSGGAGQAGGGVEIRVRDAGPGIPGDEVPHLWDRFYRGSGAGAAPGTGLGLALVKRIVEAHGGRVGVESRVGEGSTFVIWLPAAV